MNNENFINATTNVKERACYELVKTGNIIREEYYSKWLTSLYSE